VRTTPGLIDMDDVTSYAVRVSQGEMLEGFRAGQTAGGLVSERSMTAVVEWIARHVEAMGRRGQGPVGAQRPCPPCPQHRSRQMRKNQHCRSAGENGQAAFKLESLTRVAVVFG
jgi:hypothetical protein